MKVEYLSASRIKTFEQCPMQYKAKYELGIPGGPEHPLTTMGKNIHVALEYGLKAIKEGRPVILTDLLNKELEKSGQSKENRDLAHSLLKNSIDWGYLRNVHCNIGLELPFFLKLKNGVPVKGLIDRLDIVGNTAYIIDIKTQQVAFEDDELQSLWQTIIYAWAVRKLYPCLEDDIHISYWTLRHRVQKTVVSLQYQKDAESKLIEVYNQISSCKAPETKPTALCQWCPYSACPDRNKDAKARFSKWKK